MKDARKTKTQSLEGRSASANNLKTWLAKAVTQHPDPDGGGSSADFYQYYLVEASNEEQARDQAMGEHCEEAFDDDDAGEWGYLDVRADAPPIRCFRLSESSAPVDAGCCFGIVWVKQVPRDEYEVLKKWLR